MQYVVKPGAKAFLDGALRKEGYVHQVEKAYDKTPAWAEDPKKSKAKKPEPKKQAPKGTTSQGKTETPDFSDGDVAKNPTVQL